MQVLRQLPGIASGGGKIERRRFAAAAAAASSLSGQNANAHHPELKLRNKPPRGKESYDGETGDALAAAATARSILLLHPTASHAVRTNARLGAGRWGWIGLDWGGLGFGNLPPAPCCFAFCGTAREGEEEEEEQRGEEEDGRQVAASRNTGG
ncbi:hypothetical protein ABZP36_011366 [Zizania latifolia]